MRRSRACSCTSSSSWSRPTTILPAFHLDFKNFSALIFFFFTAFVVSNLTAKVRAQAYTARNRAATTEALYIFSKKLAGIVSLDDLLWAAAYQIAHSLKTDVVIVLPEPDGVLRVKAGFPPEDDLDQAELGAAKWSFENNRPAGRGSDTLPGAKRLFLPLRTGSGAVGVIGLARGQRPEMLLTPDERRLLDALMDQSAVAIERVRLAGQINEARLAAETERLARGAADLPVARPQDAARLDPGRRNLAQAISRYS